MEKKEYTLTAAPWQKSLLKPANSKSREFKGGSFVTHKSYRSVETSNQAHFSHIACNVLHFLEDSCSYPIKELCPLLAVLGFTD